MNNFAGKKYSLEIVQGIDRAGHRAHLKNVGTLTQELAKPFIGIVNTYNEMHPGHYHLRELANHVRAGVYAGGGVPFEFNTIAICDGVAVGHQGMCYVLPSREVIADSIELVAQAQRFDGLVLIGSCDKIVPALLMAAARINIPSIVLTGGPMMPGRYRGMDMSSYELKEAAGKLKVGMINAKDYEEMENCLSPGAGSCSMMGTANSMSVFAEAVGMSLPGCATAMAVDGKKRRLAKQTGYKIMELVAQSLTPKQIMTARAIEDATRITMAVGGSTNCFLHIPAIADEAGITFNLDSIEEVSRNTPTLVKVKPSGKYTMVDFEDAGGVPAVMKELAMHLEAGRPTVSGSTIGEIIAGAQNLNSEIIRPVDNAYSKQGSLAVLKGNLASEGAVVKQAAVKAEALVHTGPAKVYESEEQAVAAIKDSLVKHGDVVVIRNEGPKGGPGMREMLTATGLLIGMELNDVCLVTDGRFSGATHGLAIGHVCPEAAAGGVIALVKDGDLIKVDIPNRTLELKVPEAELEKRRAVWQPQKKELRGYLARYVVQVGGTNEGAVLKAKVSV